MEEQTRLEQLIALCDNAYQDAQKNKSKIENDWRVMDQYSISSKKFKLLLNNLCTLEDASYLELGCFRGGTLIAALYTNTVTSAYAVDNFKYDPRAFYTNKQGERSNYNPDGWENVKMTLIDNLEKLSLDKSVKLFADDWDKIPATFIKTKVNIIHVDIPGNIDTMLNLYCNKFTDTSVVVVSNFNDPEIREQFNKFINTNVAKFEIRHSITKFSSSNADSDGWWNGLGMFVIERKVVSL